jgi:hypothetical protein
MGGTGEVSAVREQEQDEAQVWDNHFRLCTFGYGKHFKFALVNF